MSTVPGEPLVIVAALARNGVIGDAGKLPWHEPEDLRHFKEMTRGHAVVMGRKTWESLGRPLPDRRNLVVTRQGGYVAPGAEVHATFASALAAARATDAEPRVIGGADLYAQALPLATRLELTEIDCAPAGDVRFPPYDASLWQEAARRTSGRLTFRTLVRIPA